MAKRGRFPFGAVLLGLVAGAVLVGFVILRPTAAEPADPNALWRIVHTLCVTDQRATGNPAPCSKVDLAGRYAILKDIRGQTQLLLIPTDRIAGIESPAVLADGSRNYWQDAWAARPLFEARAGQPVPRDDVALVINSVYGRTQNQLHIHIDCIRPQVRELLDANQGKIGSHWADFPVTLAGRRYRAMRLIGADLGDRDPFKLLAEDPDARADMSRETVAVIGTTFADGRPGFLLLSDRADWATFDKGSAESLMDHACAILRPPSSAS